jgi:hypothetical protein
MDKNLIPIVLFVCMTYALKMLIDARMRYIFFKGNAPDTVAALLAGEERMRRMGSLRWGVILLAVGVGFAAVEMLGFHSVSAGSVAVLLVAAGAGNLLAFGVTQRFGNV